MHLSGSGLIVNFSNNTDLIGVKSGRSSLTYTQPTRRKHYRERSKISVVVPVYNEIKVIKIFHETLVENLKVLKRPFEIIYVDDCSNDGTYKWLIKQANNFEEQGVIRVLEKQGRKGKAYSLIQGFDSATGGIFVMIDADLQYPPAAIPAMVSRLLHADIIVADWHYEEISFVRKVVSKTFRYIFGKSLFGLDFDIQSGLKMFRSQVYKTAKFSPSSEWTFDLEFLRRATYAGYSIENFVIPFSSRTKGSSKVDLLPSIWEIGSNALLVRLKNLLPVVIPANVHGTMRGAGIGYKNHRYITHTTLSHKESALQTWSGAQVIILLTLIVLVVLSAFFVPLMEARILITLLSIFYFVDTIFNLNLILRSLNKPVEIAFADEELRSINDRDLPVYSILCPLYKEAQIVAQFLESIEKLDYPKQKLDVMLLLEEDDRETVDAAGRMLLPSYVRVIVVPHSYPKTKPKACNYGLSFARGELLVIYDAEDAPEPMQLKKAYLGFKSLPGNIRCLQAKLNYYNPHQNFLTRMFTAEYSLWFDLTLTGLQSLNSAIPLGGTSNHFRTRDLRKLQGWDPFNVTEDADLGVRLFKKGYKTAIIDSTTLEEANSVASNWLRQRSRWIKGYMQTYLVHMRDFRGFVRENGFRHAFIFQLTIGGKLLFLLINPLLWIVTFFYFAFHNYTGLIIELVYYPPMSYFAVFSLVFGNFLFLFYYMIACAKRNQWSLIKYVYLIPLYWAMMSYAALIALYQLFFKPHYWEKTIHGLYLKDTGRAIQQKVAPQVSKPVRVERPRWVPVFTPAFAKKFLFGFYHLLFLGADVVLVRFIYPDSIALRYLYFSLIGKSIYIGSLFFSFSTFSVFKRLRGHMKEKSKVVYLVFSTFLTSWIGVVIFGFLGTDISSVSFELLSFTIAMMFFAIANVIVLYNLRRNIYTFLAVAYITSALQLTVIFLSRTGFSHIIQMTVFLAGADVLLMFLLQLNKEYFRVVENNLGGLFGLLGNDSIRKSWESKSMRILIFNWRDTQHIYAGGAEVYVHELAKRWVGEGNKVTMFCGNDNRQRVNEVIDGVEIFRRGGTYTVYLFAFIYYLVKFRGKYDLIIDCENGIPFFTPLYVRKPIILVIHHVHQDIIRKYLRFPIAQIAATLEAKVMPSIYRDRQVVTVSESSKEEIIKLGFTREENIEIVYNGTSVKNDEYVPKTEYPSFLYLGRLQDYKNIDVAIEAFAKVARKYPSAKLNIVGFGESQSKLRKLAERLKVAESVSFMGKVSDRDKARLLSEAWVVLQPSQVEGWGITVIEANACGTPVIASRVNGLRDSVVHGRTGILVQYRSAGQFAKAMENLIQDTELRERLSREAYLWSRNFSWSKSAEFFYGVMGKSIPYNPEYLVKGEPALHEVTAVNEM